MVNRTVAARRRRAGGLMIGHETRVASVAATSWLARLAIVLVALAAAVTGAGYASAASGPAANIDQCRNGTFADPVVCTGAAWANGDLGSENSHYREGASVPFRVLLDGLTAGDTYTVAIQYDTLKDTKHAYDYLTSYDATETTADPTSGYTGLTAGNCFPIPTDPDVINQDSGCISIWNGTITNITYGEDSTTGTQTALVTFTASSDTVLLAWGGHVASQLDWGLGNSASAISGAPYHMRVLSIKDQTTNTTTQFGNQDRSMKANAIPPMPTLETTASSATVALGQSLTDTATLSGPNGPVTGTIQFSVCGPDLVGNPTCTAANSSDFGGAVTIINGTAVSGSYTPQAPGRYCFRAVYTPDATAAYSAAEHTDQTSECFNVIATVAIVTNASANVTVGGSISDSIVLSGGVSPTGTITLRVYGPDDATCSGTARFTDSIPVDHGNGTYGSPAHVIDVAGTYRFVASYGGDGNNNAVSGACNDANESVVVGKASPAIVTNASANVTVGGSISDSIVLSGGVSPTGTITLRVYGPDDATCSGTARFTDSIPVDHGNGTYGSPAHVIDVAGTYRFVASYGGDGNNNAVSGACNDANESVVVGKASPAIVTNASANVTVGGAISDSIVLSGGVSPTGTITLRVYGPDDATCSGTARFTDSIPVDHGNGTYGSPAHVIDVAGTYRFVASYGGDGNNNAVSGACNDANESVVVGKASPAIVTNASATVPVGDQIHDTIVLSGGFNPTGTITLKAYGPNDASCSGATLFTDTITVNGNGTYNSPAHTINTPGTYRFVASYSGDGNNNGVAGACNDTNESVVVISASIAIEKNPKSQTILKGTTATFTIKVTNTGDVPLM